MVEAKSNRSEIQLAAAERWKLIWLLMVIQCEDPQRGVPDNRDSEPVRGKYDSDWWLQPLWKKRERYQSINNQTTIPNTGDNN